MVRPNYRSGDAAMGPALVGVETATVVAIDLASRRRVATIHETGILWQAMMLQHLYKMHGSKISSSILETYQTQT